MNPYLHFVFSALLAIVIGILFPNILWTYLILMFLASFLVDLDHYAWSILKTGRWSFRESFALHRWLAEVEDEDRRRGIRKKYYLHFFHVIELSILVLIIGLFWEPALFVFFGMAFHMVLDISYALYKDRLYTREYFLTNWLYKKLLAREH
jgi:hypothetical protein